MIENKQDVEYLMNTDRGVLDSTGKQKCLDSKVFDEYSEEGLAGPEDEQIITMYSGGDCIE